MHLFDKASFSSKTFQLKVNIEPGQHNVAQVSLHNRILCIESLEWKYSVDPQDKRTRESGYGWPKQALQITIDGCCEAATSSPQTFKPPVVKRDTLEVMVNNPSSLPVTLVIDVSGILATPADNSSLSDQELQGYCLLDDNARGLLALQGAAEAGRSLRCANNNEQLALEQQDSLKALTYERPSTELRSLLIGDLMQASVDISDVMALTNYLLDQGWTR